MSELQFGSLMDLANLDTSDMKAQLSRLRKEGMYALTLQKIEVKEQPPQDDPAKPMNYNVAIPGLIEMFWPIKEEDKERASDVIGQTLADRHFLFGENLRDSLELLMGRFKSAGFRHKGRMGGMEGQDPGWLDEAVGKRVIARVRHGTRAGGNEQAYIDWLNPKQLAKAGIPWDDVMQRPFLDENGNEIPIESAVKLF